MKNRSNMNEKYKSKINEKSTQNQSNIHQKSIKNLPKIDLGDVLGPLGASWGVLAASWGVLGHLGGVLAASWGVLGASWRRPGASWGRLGGQHGSNLAPKTEPKSIKNRSKKRLKFRCLLGSEF